MVPMKENEGLFMNDNEECIEQFGKFAQNKELDPKTGRTTPVECRGVIAEVIPKSIIGEIVIKLRGSAKGPDPRKEGKAKVPEGEDFAPRPGRVVFHVGAASDDEDDVEEAGDNRDGGAILHPGEDRDGVVEAFEGEVGFAEKGVEAGEFGVLNSKAVGADAFFGNAAKDDAHGDCGGGDGGMMSGYGAGR
mmetsp:Transcript_5659/g.12297  ORF Transcript_5659/g.12297 Transcript_5659/m.12297 type:complete len:191 (+) Transcript_5659:754-1326(+)